MRAATAAEPEDKIHSRIAAAAATNPQGSLAHRSVHNRNGKRCDLTGTKANLFSTFTLVTGDERGNVQTFDTVDAVAEDHAARRTKPKLLGPKNLQLYISELQIRRPSPHRRAQGRQGRGDAGSRAGRNDRLFRSPLL
jgi:hypothetical protein